MSLFEEVNSPTHNMLKWHVR